MPATAHPKPAGVPVIRSVILSHYAEVTRSLEIDTAAMLRRTGIDAACLVDPDLPIPLTRAIELMEISAIESGVRDFGIRLALARGIPDIGPLNLLLREEPDLRSVLYSLQHYLPVHSRSMSVTIEERAGTAVLSSNFSAVAAPYAATQSTEMVVCGLLQTLRWLMGPAWTPLRICFAHAGPRDTHPQRRLLRCTVAFGQAFDGLVLDGADLDLPVAHANPQMRQHAEQYVRSLAGASSPDFEDAVRRLILLLLPAGRCSAATVARHLGMDRTTLNRKLAKGGHTYSSLLQAARTTAAARACLSGRPMAELADQLGFSGLSTFSRWFSQSFGCTPRAWRHRHAEHAA